MQHANATNYTLNYKFFLPILPITDNCGIFL